MALQLSETLNNFEIKGETYNNLAELYYSQGKYELAEALYRQALEIREQDICRAPAVFLRLNYSMTPRTWRR